jgi:hypothetical protein
MTLDPNHPMALELIDRGFKLAVHVYLRDGALLVCASAYDAKTRQTLHGRSRRGDFGEAMVALGHAAGLLGGTLPASEAATDHSWRGLGDCRPSNQ